MTDLDRVKCRGRLGAPVFRKRASPPETTTCVRVDYAGRFTGIVFG